MKIILLRHGETIWNKERRLQGCQDIPLAPAGIEQIRQVGKHLAQSNLQIDLILSSPLLRARSSAEIIAEELNFPVQDILNEPLFVERSFGVCEGLTYEEALTQYPDGNYPGMETLNELFKRAEAAIRKCTEEYQSKTVLVTAHGAIIKAILGVLSGGKIEYFDKDVWIENGSWCLLDMQPDGWNIETPHFHSISAPHSVHAPN